MAKASQRHLYLDILKILAIVMVCSYHFCWAGGIGFSDPLSFSVGLRRMFFGINSTCVPLFFMVNGALLLSASACDVSRHFKKIFWLLVQFYLWRSFTVVFVRAYHKAPILGNSGGGGRGLLALIDGAHDGVDLSHLWFIPVLIGIYFLYPFLYREFQSFSLQHISRSYIFPFIGVLFVVYFIPTACNTLLKVPFFPHASFSGLTNMLPFSGLSGPMLLYFLIGGILHTNQKEVKKIPFWVPISGLVLGMLALYYRWYLESSLSQSTWDSVFGAYVTLPCLLMSISLFILAAKIPFSGIQGIPKKFIEILGSNTLAVYYWHWIVGYTVLSTIGSHISQRGFFINIGKAVFLVVILSFLSHFIKKIPFLRKFV